MAQDDVHTFNKFSLHEANKHTNITFKMVMSKKKIIHTTLMPVMVTFGSCVVQIQAYGKEYVSWCFEPSQSLRVTSGLLR